MREGNRDRLLYYEADSFYFENQNFTKSIKKGMPNLNDIKNLLQNNKITEFVKLNKLSSRDIIEFTNRYTNWAGKLFQHIDIKHAARVFKFLRKKKQEIIIKSLPDEKAAELLNELQPDDRTAFLGLLPGTAVKELLKI